MGSFLNGAKFSGVKLQSRGSQRVTSAPGGMLHHPKTLEGQGPQPANFGAFSECLYLQGVLLVPRFSKQLLQFGNMGADVDLHLANNMLLVSAFARLQSHEFGGRYGGHNWHCLRLLLN